MSERDYIVAGHRFSIVMEDDSFIWSMMSGCYGPFQTEKSSDADYIF